MATQKRSARRRFSNAFACLSPLLLLAAFAAPAQASAGFQICTAAANCQAGSTGGLGGELNSPSGVAYDPTGTNVYVADGGERIQRFDSSGNFGRAWGEDVGGAGFDICTVAANCTLGNFGTFGGELDTAFRSATDGLGNVYVADGGNHRIQKFDSSGTFLLAFGDDVGGAGVDTCSVAANCHAGSTGTLGGELVNSHFIGVAADSAGNVYVADGTNNRIQKFDSSGNFVSAWGDEVGGTNVDICTVAASCHAGSTDVQGGDLQDPTGVATDGTNVYVADTFNSRIQKFDPSGSFQLAWGEDVGGTGTDTCAVAANCHTGQGASLGEALNNPNSVATDGTSVYVAGSDSRIQKFDSSGGFLRAWGKGVNGGTSFGICTVAANCQFGGQGGLGGELNFIVGGVTGVATDGTNVYVADIGNNRIQKFDSSGNFLRAWGKDVIQPSLSVSIAGAGSGTVTGTGINCPGTCSNRYVSGTLVTLTATPAPGSTFSGWSGGSCSGTGACPVTMGSDQAVTATFTLIPLPTPGPTGQRAAALKKCKHKHGKRRKKCKKKANLLPV